MAIAPAWKERKVIPSIRVISSKDKATRVFIERVEQYTRSDISCGSSLCLRNCRIRDALSEDIRRYVFPTATCVERYIDCFENETISGRHGVVLCLSELQKISRHALRLVSRIRSLYRDRRKNFYLFDDVHHEEEDVKGPVAAAGWYLGHLSEHQDVSCSALVDDDDDDYGRSIGGDGCIYMYDYMKSEWGQNDEIMNLFMAAREARKSHDAAASVSRGEGIRKATHAQIERGIQRGVYIKGTLKVDGRHSARSYVVKDDGGLVQIMSREDRWHAIHGDDVVVELIQEQSAASCIDDGDVDDTFSSLVDEDVNSHSQAVQQRGRVLHVVQRRYNDVMVAISKQDEKALLSLGPSDTMKSVICVPFDHRFPKLRVKSRHLDTYISKRFLVRIIGWDEDSSYPHAHILKCMGPMGDLKTETDVLLHRHGLLFGEFVQGALHELPSGGDTHWVPREDEIQSEIARDASYLEEEAASRCTTVYLVDRRLDMLPSQISENAASLLSGKPRFPSVWCGRLHTMALKYSIHGMDDQSSCQENARFYTFCFFCGNRFEIVEEIEESFIRIFIPQVDLRGIIRFDSPDRKSTALSLLFPSSSETEHISIHFPDQGQYGYESSHSRTPHHRHLLTAANE
eukprot:jgi/Picre1/30635/NNA_005996.t1